MNKQAIIEEMALVVYKGYYYENLSANQIAEAAYAIAEKHFTASNGGTEGDEKAVKSSRDASTPEIAPEAAGLESGCYQPSPTTQSDEEAREDGLKAYHEGVYPDESMPALEQCAYMRGHLDACRHKDAQWKQKARELIERILITLDHWAVDGWIQMETAEDLIVEIINKHFGLDG